MKTLYEELGVAKDANADEIKKAYRREALNNHPDRGGDATRFKQVALAYRVLSDADKRRRYDQGESAETAGSPDNEIQQAIGILVQLYFNAIGQCDPKHANIVGLVKKMISDGRKKLGGQIKATRLEIKRFEDIKKRTRVKEGNNILSRALDAKISDLKLKIDGIRKELRLGKLAGKMLEAYQYDFTPPDLQQLQQQQISQLFGLNYSTWGPK